VKDAPLRGANIKSSVPAGFELKTYKDRWKSYEFFNLSAISAIVVEILLRFIVNNLVPWKIVSAELFQKKLVLNLLNNSLELFPFPVILYKCCHP
jgi:hypothetical protein